MFVWLMRLFGIGKKEDKGAVSELPPPKPIDQAPRPPEPAPEAKPVEKTEEPKIDVIVKPETTIFDIDQVRRLGAINFSTYATLVMPLAKQVQAESGIFWMVPVIQSAHESTHGTSELARDGLNVFGIKDSQSWQAKNGPTIVIPSLEDRKMSGKKVPVVWRRYGSWNESFTDWMQLMHKPAYAEVLPLLQQGEAMIEKAFIALGKVYAWDDDYAIQLIGIYRSIK